MPRPRRTSEAERRLGEYRISPDGAMCGVPAEAVKARIEAERAYDVPGGVGEYCPKGGCSWPTRGVAVQLFRAKLRGLGFNRSDIDRVNIASDDFRGASYPYLATVRVDGREIYRVLKDPDELFRPDVVEDVVKALRR